MNKKSSKSTLHVMRMAGFNFNYIAAIRDGISQDIVLFDMLGPLQAIRGAWASLYRLQNNYILGGPTKIQKVPGHHVIRTQLPCGTYNWTIISRQAIPKMVRQDYPTYFWYEPNEYESPSIPPINFMPIFEIAAPFPVKSEWAPVLWDIGKNIKQIERLPDATGVIPYKMHMKRERWEEQVSMAIRDNRIS